MPEVSRIYTDTSLFSQYQAASEVDYYRSGRSDVSAVENAVVLPCIKRRDANGKSVFVGGVIDAKGKFFTPSAHIHSLDDETGSLKQGYEFDCSSVVEDGLTLGGDDLSRQLSDAFGLALRIFTEVRSWRSKEGLDILKAEGRKLGRPSGSLNKSYKLDEHARELRRLLSDGVPMSKVARKFNVDINTLRRYLKLHPELKPEVSDA